VLDFLHGQHRRARHLESTTGQASAVQAWVAESISVISSL
jgi:hypothetical protein